jgi:nitroreductase/NAD-dependent dihydropyrimidine dehydrogenase PreA subunit
MLSFTVNEQKCTRCGLCVNDCPVKIISLADGIPTIGAEKEVNCLKCQHCLAICPTAALSILGINPDECQQLEGHIPEPKQLETLIRGRRSVRHYRNENVDPQTIQQLLNVAGQAATGVNARQVLFTVVDDKQMMATLRNKVMAGLDHLVQTDALPDNRKFFEKFVLLWQEKKIDTLFRDAPHLVIASAPRQCPTPKADCLIALTTFELYAQNLGVGTVWDGFAQWAINDLVPELKHTLRIPENHIMGYVMAFGYPAVKYQRTVEHGEAHVARVDWL